MADVLHLRGPVLVGPGPDDEHGEAWVLDGRLTFSRPTGDHEVTELEGWVLPGLVDAHAHVGLLPDGVAPRDVTVQQARDQRDAGVLLLRDAGQPGDTRWIDDREDLPKIVRAGRHIARTKRYVRGYAHEVEPDELAARVRAEARRGDGWVKIVGDWIDRSTGDLAPCWPADALVDAMTAAHEEGARVTAHCFGEECLPDLLAAGVDGIEHATGLEPATMAVAAERGVAIVPTLVQVGTFPQIAAPARGRYDTYADHMLALHERRYATVAAAFESGVPVYAGTDAGGSLAHGIVAQELAELVTAGLSPLQALDAACWGARTWLGRPGLAEGEPADLVVYAADARADVAVVAHPRAVVLRGRVV